MPEYDDDKHPRASDGKFSPEGAAPSHERAHAAGRKAGKSIAEGIRRAAEKLHEGVEAGGEKAEQIADTAITGSPYEYGRLAFMTAGLGVGAGLSKQALHAGKRVGLKLIGERQRAGASNVDRDEREPQDDDVED